MSPFPRLVVLAVAAALVVAAAPVAAPATTDGPTATAAKKCSAAGLGGTKPTYVIWVRAQNIRCRKARERVRAFHDCRPGLTGRCPNLGAWSCHENRGPSTAYAYYSTVKCTRGAKLAKHRYYQNK